MNIRPEVAHDELIGRHKLADRSVNDSQLFVNNNQADQHTAFFYQNPKLLCKSLSEALFKGLQKGEGFIIIAIPQHVEWIQAYLYQLGLDPAVLKFQKQIRFFDARTTLNQFMQDNLPNREKFSKFLSDLIGTMLVNFSRVGLYGEMANLLWEDRNVAAAEQLENISASIQISHSFSIICAYSMDLFQSEVDDRKFSEICRCHNEIYPAEDFQPKSQIQDYLHLIAKLQQKTFALQAEIVERKVAEEALKKSERELQKAKEDAEAADFAKSRFLANMSHEIRSPLTGILGFTELLKDNQLSESDRSAYFEIIARNGRQLSSLINDILDLSKAETNKLDIENVPVSIISIAAEIVKRYQKEIVAKGLHIRVLDVPSYFPSIIYSDTERIQQVLTNLIGNAVKFTHEGEIKISFESSIRPSDGAITVGVRIEDTGIGMSLDQQQRLFQPFIQADPSATRKYGGTGLGLVLAKKLAQALGGDVVIIKSLKAKGSTFLTTFNSHIHDISQINNHYTAHEAERIQRQLSTQRLAGARILYAEDSPDNQILVKKYLSSAGAYVDIAENGAEAIEKALKGEYHLILMDVMMPICDGYDATRRLRRSGFNKPIIALTAHALPEERSRSIAEGCTEHLTKPISRDHLVNVVHRYLFEEEAHFNLMN